MAETGVNFDFEVKFDLEGQDQSTPKTIGILKKVFYTYGPNLVILAWTDNELSRGQTWWRMDGLTDGLMDGRTDRQTQATTIPEGHNWPRVKIINVFQHSVITGLQSNILVYYQVRYWCDRKHIQWIIY